MFFRSNWRGCGRQLRSPGLPERRERPILVCGLAGTVSVMAILSKSGRNGLKMLQHEGLKFRIKKGQYLEIFAANLLKEENQRYVLQLNLR
jgi:hypothetical protein